MHTMAQTDRQTNRQTDKQTWQLLDQLGPLVKITQPLRTKKIMQPLGTKEISATSRDKKITQPFGQKNHATSQGLGLGPNGSKLVQKFPNGTKWV